MAFLSKEELADRAGVPEETVDRFVELGIVTPADDGSFGQPDVYRVRLLGSCDRVGVMVIEGAVRCAERCAATGSRSWAADLKFACLTS
jgi:hypothetical protein